MSQKGLAEESTRRGAPRGAGALLPSPYHSSVRSRSCSYDVQLCPQQPGGGWELTVRAPCLLILSPRRWADAVSTPSLLFLPISSSHPALRCPGETHTTSFPAGLQDSSPVACSQPKTGVGKRIFTGNQGKRRNREDHLGRPASAVG